MNSLNAELENVDNPRYVHEETIFFYFFYDSILYFQTT